MSQPHLLEYQRRPTVNILCILCEKIAIDPYLCLHGHSCCFRCHYKIVENKIVGAAFCKVCQFGTTLTKDWKVDEVVHGSIRVNCPFCKIVNGTRDEVSKHIANECASAVVDCPLYRVGCCSVSCQGQVLSSLRKEHVETVFYGERPRLVEKLRKMDEVVENLRRKNEAKEFLSLEKRSRPSQYVSLKKRSRSSF